MAFNCWKSSNVPTAYFGLIAKEKCNTIGMKSLIYNPWNIHS